MKLEKGEIICSTCKGSGTHTINEKFTCQRCYGKGKVDWIENIIGKKTIRAPFVYAPYMPLSYYGIKTKEANPYGIIVDNCTA